MANYYISTDRGSDSDGSGSATSPWKTIGKAIGAAGAAAAGDTVYVEPGIYRETIAMGVGGSPGSPITVIGDGDGAGFAAGGFATPRTGVVEVAAWTDDASPFTTSAVVLGAVNKSYVAFRGFKLVGGAGSNTYSCLDLSGGSSNWTFEDCIFFGSTGRGFIGRLETPSATALSVTFRRCDFVSVASSATYYGLDVRSPLSASEYGLDVLVENCNFFGGAGGIRFIQIGGSGPAWSTGATIQHCGFWFCYRGIYIASPPSLTMPLGVYGCNFQYGSYGVVATTAGQVVEDGDAFLSPNPVTKVTAGAHSLTTLRPAWNLHDERLYGGLLRPCFEPSASSPLIGAGAYGSPPAVDLWNRGRPEGGGSSSASIGAIERHDTGVKDVTHQDSGSPACLALIGPASQDRPILVNAQETTIRVNVRWDGGHGDDAKPQAMLLASPEIGVPAQVVTAASTGGTGSTPNAYETLTFAPITPTAAGVVMLRMISRSASGAGAAYFDTITLS
jgi:hypothetical protein